MHPFALTRDVIFSYSSSVRWFAILIGIALLHDLLAPHPTSLSIQCDGKPSIATLDVCYTPGPAPAEDEMPTVSEPRGTMVPALNFSRTALAAQDLPQLLLAVPDDHPPEAASLMTCNV